MDEDLNLNFLPDSTVGRIERLINQGEFEDMEEALISLINTGLTGYQANETENQESLDESPFEEDPLGSADDEYAF